MREGIASFEKYIQYLSAIFLSHCDLGIHNAILISLKLSLQKIDPNLWSKFAISIREKSRIMINFASWNKNWSDE